MPLFKAFRKIDFMLQEIFQFLLPNGAALDLTVYWGDRPMVRLVCLFSMGD